MDDTIRVKLKEQYVIKNANFVTNLDIILQSKFGKNKHVLKLKSKAIKGLKALARILV